MMLDDHWRRIGGNMQSARSKVVKATGATDKAAGGNQPHVQNIRLVEDTRSGAGAPGFDLRYGWVPAIAILIVLYATIAFFFD
jgi:hypothetical protein